MKKYAIAISFLLILCIFSSCERKSDLEVKKVEKKIGTAAEQKIISGNPVLSIIDQEEGLRVAVRSDYPPYMYLNENNELIGLLVESEKAIFDEMNYKYTFIPITDVGKALQDLKVGAIHAALGLTNQSIFAEYKLAKNYFSFAAYIFVRPEEKDINGPTPEELLASLSGKTIGVQTRGSDLDMVRGIADIKYKEYATGTVALQALADGEVDAKIEILEVVYDFNLKHGTDLIPTGVPIYEITANTGFYPGLEQAIVNNYNQALDKVVAGGTIDKIYKKYFPDKD